MIDAPGSGIESWLFSKALICDGSYDFVSNYMSLLLTISMCLSCALIVPMADFHGRRSLNIVLGLVLLVAMLLLLASIYSVQLQNLKLVTFMICVVAGTSAARALVSLLYFTELTTRSNTTLIMTVGFSFVTVKLLVSYSHMVFTTLSYTPTLYFYVGMNVLSLLILLWILPESPHHLYSTCGTGSSKEFFAALHKLHWLNHLFAPSAIDSDSILDVKALRKLDPRQQRRMVKVVGKNQDQYKFSDEAD